MMLYNNGRGRWFNKTTPDYFTYIKPFDLHRYREINKSLNELRILKDIIFRGKNRDQQKQKRLFDIFLDKQFLLMENIYSIQNIIPPRYTTRLEDDTAYIHDITTDMIRELGDFLKKTSSNPVTTVYGIVSNNFDNIV